LHVHVEEQRELNGDSKQKQMSIVSTGFHLCLILIALVVWKFIFFPANSLLPSYKCLAMCLALMFTCGCAVYLVLVKWSAPSVREDASEITFYLIFSIIWIAFTQGLFAFLGVSIRDDVAERRNVAAGFTVASLTIAATCCAAGSNIGDGPGFEAVLFCAVLSTAGLLVLWAVVAQFSGIADAITIDRNVAAGIRTAGWLAGTGVVLGACVAGDWISYKTTLRDFARFGWPVAIIALLFAMMERAIGLRAKSVASKLATSLAAAVSMAVAGAIYALWVGRH